jgi:hypothetical protein
MNGRKWTWRGAVVGVFLAAGACGLFETRAPEQPPPPTESGCRPLTAGTLNVVLNIEDFYGRLSGRTCYASTLDTSFVFIPDPQDVSLFLPSTPFDGWDEVVETQVNENIATQKFIEVDFINEYASAIISPDQTTEQRFWNYQLRIAFQTPPDTLRFTGKADLTLHRGNTGEWKITNWVDHRGTVSDSTWGFLRGSHRI